MSLGPLYVLPGEVSVQVLCPFLNWIVCLPRVESCKFFIYFGVQTLVQGVIGTESTKQTRMQNIIRDFEIKNSNQRGGGRETMGERRGKVVKEHV